MLDIKFIRDNAELVKEAVKNKQLEGTVDIDKLLSLYGRYTDVLKKVETFRNLKNTLSTDISKVAAKEKTKLIKQATAVKEDLEKEEKRLVELKMQIDELALFVPNVPAEDVPIGKSDRENVVARTCGELPKFDFTPKDHVTLGSSLGIIDFERGAKVAGFRGYFLKREGAELSQALMLFAIDLMKNHGFEFMTVPVLVKPEFFVGTGYFPWGESDHYKTQDDVSLVGTAEVSLTSYYADEVLSEADLPVKLVGISPCFRREIGSYGKDAKGVFRVHEFTKVEQVVLGRNDEAESREWHEKMVAYSEELLTALKLPYHVLLMCTGDMGPGQRKKYDVETWFPAQNLYRETHSASYFLDFQARRLNIRYRAKDGNIKYVHTLNNTVAATPRLLAAILENYQQKDGSVRVPEALRKYVGFDVIGKELYEIV